MDWRRTLLSVALVGGCIWCLGMVQKAYSEERAVSAAGGPSVHREQQAVSPGEELARADAMMLKPIRH